jgi:hypothetical protein
MCGSEQFVQPKELREQDFSMETAWAWQVACQEDAGIPTDSPGVVFIHRLKRLGIWRKYPAERKERDEWSGIRHGQHE